MPPMQKIYLLLRNNQQSGPYSAEELQALGLLPADLIWTEGKIGWKNSGDIPGLVPGKTREEKISTASTPTRSSPNQKAGKIFVSLPGHFISKDKAEAISETDPALILEKKAEALYQKIQAFQEQQTAAPKEELETKYARSLDDIRNEYAGWLHQQKNKTKFPVKPVVLAASFIVIIITGLFLFQSSPLNIEENHAPIKFVSSQQSAPAPVSLASKNITEPAATIKKKNPTRTIKKKPVNKVLPPTVKPTKKTGRDNNTYLPAMVSVSGRYKPTGKGVSASEITLQNKSAELLKVVAVDVIYYNPDGSFLTKETVYFRDISPRTSRTLKAPSHGKAEEVKYKMGLISASESGLYYAMN